MDSNKKKALNSESFLSIFLRVVEENSKNVAVGYSNESITYVELEFEGRSLAYRLSPFFGRAIFSLLPYGRNYHISLVGSMMAGCHLYPLEISEAAVSLAEKVSVFNPAVCLVDNSIDPNYLKILTAAGSEILYLGEKDKSMHSSFELSYFSDNQYLHSVFTSGSSGNPKLISFKRSTILFDAITVGNRYKFNSNDCLFSVSKLTSSLHINSFWRSILCGGTFLPTNLATVDLNLIWDQLIQTKPSIVQGQTSLLHKLAKFNCNSLNAIYTRHLIIGGEPLNSLQINDIVSKFPSLESITYNYSSTETALIASISLPRAEFLNMNTISVGTPAEGKIVLIQDPEGRNLATGQVGEIIVKSAFIADKISGLSQESDFVYDEKSGVKIYRTGDIGYYDEFGNLVHLGRKDRQLKINGVRIDPLLIENEVLKIPEINEVKIIAIKLAASQINVIVGAIVANKPISHEKITDFIKERLPFSHIPKLWIEFGEIPITERGKVNVNKLEEEAIRAFLIRKEDTSLFVDVNESKQQVIDFITREWSHVLGISNLSPIDSVFYHGAESIQLFMMIHTINERWKISLNPEFLIKFPTIVSQADEILKIANRDSNDALGIDMEEIKRKLGF
jgi:acyl-CoA synthetase (AMP-forming)/AMP-acid ligase II/acyl carrier protein